MLRVGLEEMIGVTMASVKKENNDVIRFKAEDGREWMMHHVQD